MDIPILKDLIVMFGLSIILLLFCHRLHIPNLVGFLFTGVLCGPHGLGVVRHLSEVKSLAEFGIIMLLFTVGMEFSLRKVLMDLRFFMMGGSLQVGLTTFVGAFIGYVLERPWGESVFLGFLLSLSSTAIVLRLLLLKDEAETPHGRMILAILIFQDLIVVPMVLLVPLLAGKGNAFNGEFFYLLLEGFLLLASVFFAALKIVPKFLHLITGTKSRELFLLAVLMVCFSVAWFVSSLGLSLALGAFLAGLIISESEYKHQAIGDIIPFQDIFTSIFFVSVGMLLDIHFVFAYFPLIACITVGVILMKILIAGLSALFVGTPLRTAILIGFSLAQIGEFSFIMMRLGLNLGIGSLFHNQIFLSVAIFTMALTPLLIHFSHVLSRFVTKISLPEFLQSGFMPLKIHKGSALEDHVVIIGFGLSGHNLANSCREAGIPYIILDMNPEKVHSGREEGEPIHFGDATQEKILKHASIKKARVVAVLANDFQSSRLIVEQVRALNPSAYLIVRTRYEREMQVMYVLGANEVVPDEFAASIQVFTRVLHRYDIEKQVIDRLVLAASP